MARKGGLGRGLDALIPGSDNNFRPSGVTEISVDQIIPNPRQPRARFDPDQLSELAASIREHGVIQPLIVTEGDGPGQYILIAGERRLLAARQEGLETVPAVIREATQEEMVELALVENVQRSDLSPLEAAEAYRQLSEDFRLSHEVIAARVGKSRVTVTNTMRLLKLPIVIQQAINEGRISEGHARALLALASQQAQEAALHTILKHDLNVRQTEELVRHLSGQKPEAAAKPATPPEIAELEERMRSSLGTKVRLNRSQKGGTLVIHFYSDEELNSIVDRILGG